MSQLSETGAIKPADLSEAAVWRDAESRATAAAPTLKRSVPDDLEGASPPAASRGTISAAPDDLSTAPTRRPTATIWQKLKQKFSKTKQTFVQKGEVDDNGSNLPCVEATSVSVLAQGRQHTVHANYVDLRELSTTEALSVDGLGAAKAGQRSASLKATPPAAGEQRVYVAGQSPLQLDRLAPERLSASEKVLLHAIDLRQGTFQIVSPRVHASTTDLHNPSPEGSIDPLIKQVLARASDDIGDAFEIVKMEHVPANRNDFLCYFLTVRDKASGEKIQVPLTQIGISFDQAVLRRSAIKRTFRRLNGHIKVNQQIDPSRQVQPVVISQAGVGRNATVIVFHAIESMISSGDVDTPAALDLALENAVTEGRAARGRDFINSEAQLLELRSALSDVLAKAQAARHS